MSALPGPPGLPIIGNLTQMMGYKRPQTHIQWTKWAKQYGPLYRVKMPGSTFVVVADPALLPTVLGRPGLPKSRVYELGFFLATRTSHDTMFSIRHTNDPMWKATRKTLALAFNPDAIRSKMPMVVQQSLGLAERLRAFGPGRDIEVQDAMARVTLDVILTTGFDLPSNAVDLDSPCPLLEDMHFLMAETFRKNAADAKALEIEYLESELGALAEKDPATIGRGFTNPFRKLYRKLAPNSPLAKEFSVRLANLHSIWHQIMTDARGDVADDDVSLWGCLAKVRDHKTGKALSGDLLQAEVAGIILGGLDTSAQTCAFTLALLAAHPEQEKALAAELDAAGLLLTPANPSPRPMAFSDLPRLTYLDGVIKESLRMFPVAATGLSRCTDEVTVLGGYLIPAGTEVQVPIYTLHMMTFPEPERFMPERWATIKAASEPAATKVHVQAGDITARDTAAPKWTAASAAREATGGEKPAPTFIPFSGGPRDCLGQRLAMMEVATILGTLIGRFTVELSPRMDGYKGLLERQTIAFTLAVDDGLWINFKPRLGWI
ncbi:cytochrome P450 [Coccomyxa subellipsoidea C-169]|uniref:Cytochrome P450 n=1 Tax=Coccomyxa subellipsoidea (strain C-169) TaxID=574566 RepID=I0YXF4_COCSC|nr:cytochrome P450 [Coccomyxa subellipsoidea C-169]EIE23073.1 cytochrome P450 [Coccomyxa subellipsoidea C-169]|eukprot:XP_005647617.1 cytochrome P450 [Coccomyxa subellipsoidea C-169]